jgi:indole-3-glycerol phosphate synthase
VNGAAVILDTILEKKNREVAELNRSIDFAGFDLSQFPPTRDFRSALIAGPRAIIAEVKRKSPSRGVLREDFDPIMMASIYEKNGAAAVSVLTDREFFGGSDADLVGIRREVGLPLLRKDFIIDASQIFESRMLGADAILLIARILGEGSLKSFLKTAGSLGLSALVEVHDRADVEKALAADAEIIGINNRDLATFSTDIRTTLDLLEVIPRGKIVVSESGINSKDDIELLASAGVRAFLIGEALVKEADPAAKLRELMGL